MVTVMLFFLLMLLVPRIILPSADVRAFPNFRVMFPVTGVFPIHTTIIRNSTVLINTTNTASIPIHHQGNYTCVATNKYGTDTREFSVIFNGKHITIGYFYRRYLCLSVFFSRIVEFQDISYEADSLY